MKLGKANILCAYLYLFDLLFSMNLLCLKPTSAANAPSSETDRLALLKFKESTNDPHGILGSWNASTHFCYWHGIKCSRRRQRVTALVVQGQKLHGSISPYIGNLTFLRFINLANNSYNGKIPQEVGNLFRLQHLDLTNNTLGGEIPSNMANCSKLNFINISGNKLVGKIPTELGSLMKLGSLRIAANSLTGGIPPSLGNLSSLRHFQIAENNLVGNIPNALGLLKSLLVFNAAGNNLSGMIPPSLYNISSIEVISTTENRLKGTLPENIGLTLPNIQYFSIGFNEFSGPIPISLSNASQLQVLDLPANNFVGQVPTDLGNLVDLWSLRFAYNNLGSNSTNDLGFLASLKNCSELVDLDFSLNNFGGFIPSSIANLSTQLNYLTMYGNQLSGKIPAALSNLFNILGLELDDNLFTGVIPTDFGRFQNMQALNLSQNRLSGQIPSSIGNLTQLFKLYLSRNKLEGSIPPSIGNCQRLQSLDVSQNNLNGAIPQQLIALSSLSGLLNLSQNSLNGSLPVEVGKLKNINALDASENNLSGQIPRTIGDCSSLEYLRLQGNSFRGSIPPSLALVKGLQYLDFSRNNLSGPIPKDLQKLPFLLHVNLSFNSLEGEVPEEGVFGNASKISVIGNSKLCGGVPQLQLLACPAEEKKRGKSLAFKLKIAIPSVVLCFFLMSSSVILHWMRKSKKKSSSALSTINFFSKVSYKTLYQATEGFSSSNLIGSGSFGSVYKGTLHREEKVVAIKVLNLQRKGASKSLMAECNALRNIRHRNLIKILTCCFSMDYNGNEFRALVFEYMTNQSLEKWLHPGNQSRSLTLLQRLNISIDVASALEYLHNHSEPPVIHCDVKPSNVLLDSDMVAHVSDFGLARLLSPINDSSQNQTSTMGIKGSIGYAAPEYGMGGEASIQGDVYSYGILVLEMFTGRRPTDEMFKDGLNLHNFVKMAMLERLEQIVDPIFLSREVEETATAAATLEEDNSHNEIQADDTENQMSADVNKCLLSILKVGLNCSMESPRDRMTMEEITRELYVIKNQCFS